jgi:hypothetical protein
MTACDKAARRAVQAAGRAKSCPRKQGPRRLSYSRCQTARKGRIASSEWRIGKTRQLRFSSSPSTLGIPFSNFFFATPFDPSFPICYSLPAIRLFLRISLPLREGHAERRWRLDACDAPRSARHDRRADASSNEQARAEPALRSLRTPGCPWLRSTCRPSDLQGQWAVRRLASPAIGNARLYGAPRGISGPGPCSPLSHRPPSPRLRRTGNRPSETSCEGLSGQPRQSLRDRAPFFARVIVTRRSRSRGPPRHGC